MQSCVSSSFLKTGTFRPKPSDSHAIKMVRKSIEDYLDSRYPILPFHKVAVITLLIINFVMHLGKGILHEQ
jgi:hypothetical protein